MVASAEVGATHGRSAVPPVAPLVKTRLVGRSPSPLSASRAPRLRQLERALPALRASALLASSALWRALALSLLRPSLLALPAVGAEVQESLPLAARAPLSGCARRVDAVGMELVAARAAVADVLQQVR